MDQRLTAVCDLMMAEVRENAGRHEYDGQVQDLSVSGVAAGLARLGGAPAPDAHDEAHLRAFEARVRLELGELQMHRRDPLLHLQALDLSGYDREYAPEHERDAARTAHLRRWPEAIDVAVRTLDAVPAPVAAALLGSARGLAAGLDPSLGDMHRDALTAHARLVEHLQRIAENGPPDLALGEAALARLMGTQEATTVDLAGLAAAAEQESARLGELVELACAHIDPRAGVREVVAGLLADHPDDEDLLAEAARQTAEVIAFTAEHRLAPHVDGQCRVGPAPASRSWAMAMLAWAGPGEPDGPSWYWITLPSPSLSAEGKAEWLAVFSRTTLPAITAHEVAPGHFAHSRALRRVTSPVRATLQSMTFAEGWAHYAEEVMLEEGFRAADPRFAVGVALEGLVRVTRLTSAIGMHTGSMTVQEATDRFVERAYLGHEAAAAEARRGTFDATYGRYTWGKLAIRDLRERARATWGAGFSLPRLHTAMLELGSPPIGLLDAALTRG